MNKVITVTKDAAMKELTSMATAVMGLGGSRLIVFLAGIYTGMHLPF